MGNFRMNMGDELTNSLPRSISASMHGELDTMTPSEMGRQEMYSQVPFLAIPGLQKKEREIASTFANFAADLDVASTIGLSDMDKSIRHASSSMLILDEMEDAKVVTAPLIFTVIVVSASMFSVGYNTGVMNAPEKNGISQSQHYLMGLSCRCICYWWAIWFSDGRKIGR